MRAGLSTIQQTLTVEAAAVLGQSISEAGRRNHGHTTPLHVAAALLASPSGYLRQACIRSHPDSSHPLQCRALELCFSVALERLPSVAQPATAAPPTEPPVSNALMAALKRAQAHQRRGCPEQQQQPLLAVKVELEQLIISILDDPSVSRVMKEAGFSSPAVKATIEQSLTSSSSTSHRHHHHHHVAGKNANFVGISQRMLCNKAPFMQNRTPYLNPRLQQGGNVNIGNHRGDEVNKLLEIMMRTKKRNPILVGDSEPESVVREFLKKIETKEVLGANGVLKNARVISIEDKNSVVPSMIRELGNMIRNLIENRCVILDLGDLKWLADHQHQQQGITEQGRAVVVEMAQLLSRFNGESNKVWLIGTANCETYLRCQVYFSSIENEWDLQAVPVASRSQFPGMVTWLETQRLLSVPLQPLNTLPALTRHAFEKIDPSRTTLCPQCSGNYENELAKIEASDKSLSESALPSLPQWLQNAKLDNSQKYHGRILDQKIQELHGRWRDVCLHLHPKFHEPSRLDRSSPPTLLSITSLHSTNPRPKKVNGQPAHSSGSSPVLTDLVLGRKGPGEKLTGHEFGYNMLDVDKYKRLLRRLMEHAWWQPEAASMVATAISRRRPGRAGMWLLFAGPDNGAKTKMSFVLAEQIGGGGSNMVTICLDEGSDEHSRGKTAIDRVAEAVRRNPFGSVVVIEGVDRWGPPAYGSLRRGAERGRISDSNGRELGLGDTVFILSGDWSTGRDERHPRGGRRRIVPWVPSWRLAFIVEEEEERSSKRPRREAGPAMLSLDLNLALPEEDDREKTKTTLGSSDVKVYHEDERAPRFATSSVPVELAGCVDGSVVFEPLDSGFVMREIRKSISVKFSEMVGGDLSLEVSDDVLEKIMGGLMHGSTSLEEWIVRVLVPGFDRLGRRLAEYNRGGFMVRLVVESGSESAGPDEREGNVGWLPSNVLVRD